MANFVRQLFRYQEIGLLVVTDKGPSIGAGVPKFKICVTMSAG